MLLIILILVPIIGGLVSFLTKNNSQLPALGASLLTLAASLFSAFTYYNGHAPIAIDATWIPTLGANFALNINSGLQVLMLALTAIIFPLVYLFLNDKSFENKSTFYGLMSLAQAGLMGVFLANDALVFYIFWELALIPVYFLSSLFGGENRIKVTFKFFVYTFVGSLLLLVAFLIIYNHTTNHSFAWTSFVESGKSMSGSMQNWMFWLVFLAFAIKMPMFPFHTWQPDAYEQSSTPVTIVLSAIMVKMGLFAVIKWLLPVLPLGVLHWTNLVTILSIIGIIYASCLAIVQTNIKRLIAYSSIAHIGLMIATLFAQNQLGTQGVAIQMFNHGINIMGLWLLVLAIEKRLGTQNLNEMGGLAKLAPKFTIALVLISLANIALPLTNGFIGEFMMFNGLFQSTSQYHIVFTVVAGLGVILAAVYTLGMIQKVAFGELKNNQVVFADLSINEWIVLIIIMGIILWLGFYPNVLMSLVS